MNLSQCASDFRRDGIVQVFPSASLQLPSGPEIKALADDVLGIHVPAGEVIYTTENIRVMKTGTREGDKMNSPDIEQTRKIVSRVENFVSSHQGWTKLCTTGGVLSQMVAMVCTDDDSDTAPWCLYKEKLNIKPPGSCGFAPHLDSPSLRVTGLCEQFVTVMIAIDDMTIDNGCLQVCRGDWTEASHVPCEEPCSVVDTAGVRSNPDGNGRRGAILGAIASRLQWEPIECKSGDVFIFSGWLPHRSASNLTQQTRRAVFLTYNNSEDGELSETYYRVMRDMRSSYMEQHIAQQNTSHICV
jgi:hypothetical protein